MTETNLIAGIALITTLFVVIFCCQKDKWWGFMTAIFGLAVAFLISLLGHIVALIERTFNFLEELF